MDYMDIAKKGLNPDEWKELSMEDLEDVSGARRRTPWTDVHEYVEEMNNKYKGANTTMEDFSPEERQHLEYLRSKGYEYWRNKR